MEITITLLETEKIFLEHLMQQYRNLYQKEFTLEEAIHECIRDSMFDEGEETAREEL